MSEDVKAAPLIGLPVRMDPSGSCQNLDGRYADAVTAAGGRPVLVPLLQDPEDLSVVAGSLHGVLLTGSDTDVDPARSGAERTPECGRSDPLRDQTDSVLLSAARRRRLPVLAICFGMQSLNVFMGGSLIQDIPSRLRSPIRHSLPEAEFVHPVEIVPGSILARSARGTSPMVNSTHHQALERVAKGLEVIARAPDGIIESVAGSSEQWILGIQWHPEKSYGYDEFSRKIFDAFLSSCTVC